MVWSVLGVVARALICSKSFSLFVFFDDALFHPWAREKQIRNRCFLLRTYMRAMYLRIRYTSLVVGMYACMAQEILAFIVSHTEVMSHDVSRVVQEAEGL